MFSKRSTMRTALCSAAVIAFIYSSVCAEGYTLFNPVPDDKLRPFTTERPSKTDGPYTVDAGHLVVETSLFNYVRNDDCNGGSCTDTRSTTFGSGTNFRLGLNDFMDFQVIVDAYRDVDVHDRSTGLTDNRSGFGDTITRLKFNITGNDGGKVALAVTPFIKFPTNQDNLGNDDVEGGVVVPISVSLDDDWSIGGQTMLTLVEQLDDSGYDPAYTNSVILGKNLTDKLSGYAEFFTYKANQSSADWQNTLDFGAVYAVNDRFHIDTGVNFGVTDAADDVNFFAGVAYRF